MDDMDRRIIGLLAEDSRRALADIGGLVGLAPSSVNERIRRMVAAGVIRRFTVETDPSALDLPLLVFLRLVLRPEADATAFRQAIAGHPRILECHHVTGAWPWLIKLRVETVAEIEVALDQIRASGFLGQHETTIALSSAVAGVFVPATMP
ncbi:Lrp/AsnC family transcriptional regulator [Gemmobacter lutimaris]|uniref:Lrp/AsnC family transcriptional regulator n=2 Tax=Gemmobacter lutimaris TaxID=2306023 RepID=A0A398C3V9_9RHOB|nr:Lrp/AsnC family transcriptional regulator [Gemmobacter lutimaris]